MRKLQGSAARQGVEEAVRFFDMTPRQVAWALQCSQALQARQAALLHMQAQLTALAVHAPRQLPPSPCLPGQEMTADEMKQRLLSWRRKDEP